MGALTEKRKRLFSSNWIFPLFSLDSECSTDFPVLKKPRISSMPSFPKQPHSPLPPENPVSRNKRFPLPPSLHREAHAPQRSLKFLGPNRKSYIESNQACVKVKKVETMGNVGSTLKDHLSEAKEIAYSSMKWLRKDDTVNGDKVHEGFGVEEYRRLVNESNSNLVTRGDKDGQNDVCLVVPEGDHMGPNLQQLASAASMSILIPEGDVERKIVEYPSAVGEEWATGLPLYKQLHQASHKRDPRLSTLNHEIRLTETKRSAFKLIKDLKKEVKEDTSTEAFVPLTDKEEDEINCALSGSNGQELIVVHDNSNIQITREILQCLLPGSWLNDEVINLYFELLKQRERTDPKKYLKCHFFNTFFYKKLVSGKNGYEFKAVRRWTMQKKIGYGLTECDKIFVPIHKEIHWCLAVINIKDRKLQYLDSLKGRDTRVLKVLARYFMDEVKDKSGENVDVGSWKQEFVDDLPEQLNGWDCGMFMIKYADFYSRGLQLCFGQEDMPYFRRRTTKEILRLKAD